MTQAIESPPLSEQQSRIQGIAKEIAEYQAQRGLSDAAICKMFAGLGSTKTFKRILEGNFEQLDPDRQEHNYTSVAALIAADRASGRIEEPDYEDMRHVVAASLAVGDAIRAKDNGRLVILEGGIGAGKTTVMRCVQAKWPNTVTCLEADVTWTPSLHVTLTEILRGLLPIETAQRSSGDALRKVLEILAQRRRVVWIDEGHHLGLLGLHVVKTLINRSPTVIVIAAIPTLLRRLEQSQFEEARQLTLNRLSERVIIPPPAAAEIGTFLTRRAIKLEEKAARSGPELLAQSAATRGNWKFVNLVARRLKRDFGADEITGEEFSGTVTSEQKRR